MRLRLYLPEVEISHFMREGNLMRLPFFNSSSTFHSRCDPNSLSLLYPAPHVHALPHAANFPLPHASTHSILDLRRLPNRLYHFLYHLGSNSLPTLSHSNSHVAQHRRMSYITRIAISLDIGCPFEFCRVGVPGAYVAGLQLLELLLGAEFICHVD